MVDKKYVYSIEAKDEASEATKKAQKGLNDVAESTEKVAKETEEASNKTSDFGGNLAKAGLAAQGVKEIYGALSKAVKRTVGAYAEQQQVERQLRWSFRQTGATATETRDLMNAAMDEFAKNQSETVFGDETQMRALQRMNVITGDTAQSMDLLTTAMDVATITGKDFEKVAESLAKAATGDVAKLKALGLITREQSQRFMKMEDTGRAVAEALDLVRQKTEGARLEVGKLTQKTAQLENDFGDVQQAAGGWTIAAGDALLTMVTLGKAAEGNDNALQGLAGGLTDNAGALRQWSDAAEWAFSGEGLAMAPDNVKRLSAGVKEMTGQSERAEKILRELAGTTEAQYHTQTLLNEAIEEHGIDSEEARKAAERYNRALTQTDSMVGQLAKSLKDELNKELETFREVTDKTVKGLGEFGINVADSLGLDTDALKDDAEELTEEEKRKRQQRAQAVELARRELQIMRAENETVKSHLMLARDRYEIGLKDMSRAERLVALNKAEIEHVDRINEIEKERLDKQLERAESLRKEYETIQEIEILRSPTVGADASHETGDPLEEREKRRLELERQRAEAIEMSTNAAATFSTEVADGLTEQNEELEHQLRLYGEIGAQAGELTNSIIELTDQSWEFENAQQATLTALEATASIGGAVSDIFIESTKEAAKFRAGFEGAAALAAFAAAAAFPAMAPQFITAGINHTAASAKYALVAGGAIGGGSGGGGGSAGGGGASRPTPPTVDLDEERRKSARVWAEETQRLNAGRAGGATFMVNFGQGNNFLAESNELFGRIRDGLEDVSRQLPPGDMSL